MGEIRKRKKKKLASSLCDKFFVWEHCLSCNTTRKGGWGKCSENAEGESSGVWITGEVIIWEGGHWVLLGRTFSVAVGEEIIVKMEHTLLVNLGGRKT